MSNVQNESDSILRRKAVEAKTGLSRSSIYQFIRDGRFPRPISLGPRTVGWLKSEVDAFISDRISASRTNVMEAA